MSSWHRVIAFGVVSGSLAACGSVGDSDPSMWTPSQDLGGVQLQTGAGAAPAAGGFPQGAGGFPQGAGGFPPSAGGFPPSAGGFPPSAGGFPPNAGGFPPSAGGFPPSAGGFTSGGGGTPPVGNGGTPPVSTGGAPATNSGTCTFSFDVTTVTYNGRYAPNNVGAIWITDGSGAFVKSLQVWGTIRLGNATAWETSSGGNTVDAVTGATRRSHGTLHATWDCTNTSHTPVPDGTYNVNVTFAEDDAIPFFGPPPHQANVTFTKGVPGSASAPDAANFTGMRVTIQ